MKQEDAVIIAIHNFILGKLFVFFPNVHGIALSAETCLQRDSFSNVPDITAVVERCVLRSNRFVMNWPRPRHAYAVVDSLPVGVCHVARIHCAKRFQGIAHIGYCASKKQWYCGLKRHLQVTD
ncbi:hypothetical protein HNQ34_000829 [Anoxybacillus tepidamans]|uniref:Transposase DDE domain-containing protein n=1 Tax=Anoxybacteroides tepidamans TaxID=265948 RepID=A0A7W8IQ01_9BACL|nr:hypothetical protein [Anoxybacillus tepidamans]